MRIIVDADACPNIDLITSLAQSYNIPLILYADTTHIINNDYAEIKIVSKGFQSVDMKIINDLKANDILITQDFGLATLALTRKSKVVSPKGLIYTEENIDKLNFEKYLSSLNRKQNLHMKGPKKRTTTDTNNLINSLVKCIENK